MGVGTACFWAVYARWSLYRMKNNDIIERILQMKKNAFIFSLLMVFSLITVPAVKGINGDLVADFNGDGTVNLDDFATFADGWLWQAPTGDVCEEARVAMMGKVYRGPLAYTGEAVIWYSFAPPVTMQYNISLCGSDSNSDTLLTVYLDCPGEEGGSIVDENDDSCGMQSSLDVFLDANETYYIEVTYSYMEEEYSSIEPTDNIDVGAPPEPEYQLLITPLSCESQPVTTCDTASDAILDTPYDGDTADGDVWYAFTPDSGVGSDYYTISLCGSDYDTYLYVYDGCPGDLILENDDDEYDLCENDLNSLIITQLDDSNTYYIRISGYEDQPGYPDTGYYYLLITQEGAGDVCDTAFVAELDETYSVNNDTQTKKVWYKFTPTYEAYYDISLTGIDVEATLNVLNGSCYGSSIGSETAGSVGDTVVVHTPLLPEGNTVYIEIGGNYDVVGDLTLQVTENTGPM